MPGNASMPDNTSTKFCLLPTERGNGEFILYIILCSIDLFLLISLLVQCKRLKSKVVSGYGLNVVIAGFVGSVTRLRDTAIQNFGDPVLGANYSDSMQHADAHIYWWTFEESVAIIIFLVFYWSIALITTALNRDLLKQSSTVAGLGPEVVSPSWDAVQKSWIAQKMKRISKRNRACVWIALTWLLPFAAVGISVAVDNCAQIAVCKFRYVPDNPSVDNVPTDKCTKLMTPLSLETTYVAFALCSFSLLMLLVAFWRSFLHYKRIRNLLGSLDVNQQQQQQQPSNDKPDENDTKPSHAVVRSKNSKAGTFFLSNIKRSLLSIFVIALIYVTTTQAVVLYLFVNSVAKIRLTNVPSTLSLFLLNLPSCVETLVAVLICATTTPLNTAIKANFYAFLGCLPCLHASK